MAHTHDETMARMAMLAESSGEILNEYAEHVISQLQLQLETAIEYKDIRFIQGQIAGIRDFCMVVKD